MEEYMVRENGANEYGDGAAWTRGPMIGKGSYGRVYLASLKINPTSEYSCCFPSVMAVKSAEVSVSSTIQKEREILTNLNGCPYVIECLGEEMTIGDNGVMAYNLLLEYGSGGTLADRIKKSGDNGLPESEVRAYTRCILRGLDHIHGLGYVHCDLKPDNILLVAEEEDDDDDDDGSDQYCRAKIGDFGVAKKSEREWKKRKSVGTRGTIMYMSPEAMMDNDQEAPSDVWALGCIVVEMLTGNKAIRMMGAKGELPKIPDGISKAAKEFIKCCLVREPMYRATSELLLGHRFVDQDDDDDDDDDDEYESHESCDGELDDDDDDASDYVCGSYPYWSDEVSESCSKRIKHY